MKKKFPCFPHALKGPRKRVEDLLVHEQRKLPPIPS
jgi:hypothetical protein